MHMLALDVYIYFLLSFRLHVKLMGTAIYLVHYFIEMILSCLPFSLLICNVEIVCLNYLRGNQGK